MARKEVIPIWLGLEWDPKKGRAGRPVWYLYDRHLTVVGPARSGKGIGFEMVLLLMLMGLSIISIDPKGQNAAVTARWRKKISRVVFINPLNVHGLGSSGFNPLAHLNPNSPLFFLHASGIAEALVKLAESGDPFWNLSARNLVLVLIMWEVTLACAKGRAPLLSDVYGMMTGNLPATARDIFNSGNYQMASLAGQFMEKNKTTEGIVMTAAAQLQWLLDPRMMSDLAKDGIDFSRINEEAITVYAILGAHALGTFSGWLRMVAACAFNALYESEGGGNLRTLFLLSEFAQLSNLSMVSSALAQGAGYGIQLCPILQDINQLRANFGPHGAQTFVGMSGATLAFTPNDPETAQYFAGRSGLVTRPELSSSDNPQTGARDTWRGVKGPRYTSDNMFDIPKSHGMVWFAGQSAPQPVYLPPYWEIKELKGRYDPDPYH